MHGVAGVPSPRWPPSAPKRGLEGERAVPDDEEDDEEEESSSATFTAQNVGCHWFLTAGPTHNDGLVLGPRLAPPRLLKGHRPQRYIYTDG